MKEYAPRDGVISPTGLMGRANYSQKNHFKRKSIPNAIESLIQRKNHGSRVGVFNEH